MGKKAKLKQIRRIASQMPEIKKTEVVDTKILKGTDLIKEGVKIVEGKDVNDKATYKQKIFGKVPINHNRKMKKLYNSNGPNGVKAYIQAVNRFVSQQKAAAAK